ncbi:hypothetical protein M2318_000478 [Metapseudomonas resinovorans]|uniref:hypothetical protein n=1 Tax=Metapseudomonas resinovorans TaxID=53412 RepID=UPI003D1CF8B5
MNSNVWVFKLSVALAVGSLVVTALVSHFYYMGIAYELGIENGFPGEYLVAVFFDLVMMIAIVSYLLSACLGFVSRTVRSWVLQVAIFVLAMPILTASAGMAVLMLVELGHAEEVVILIFSLLSFSFTCLSLFFLYSLRQALHQGSS